MNANADMKSVYSSSRPTIIEERRHNLQNLLQDYSNIPLIRNSKQFIDFLELDVR
jgi:hypothetical protein